VYVNVLVKETVVEYMNQSVRSPSDA